MEKLIEHDARFAAHDKRFDEHDRRFDEHDRRFDRLEAQVDFLALKLLEHDKRLDRIEVRLENTATKDDVARIMTTLDMIVVLVRKQDKELTTLTHRVDQVADDVDRMKPLLGLV